jgi:hypothetical protein
MKFSLYSLGLALLLLFPVVALGQTSYYMAWPAVEDTAMVPDGSNLPQYIFADTVAHQASWANHTRVYVLKANGHYDWTAACSLNVANRKLLIRGQYGKDYTIPSTNTSVYKPILQSSTASTSLFIVTSTNDTICMKNVAIAGYDELNSPTNLDKQNPNDISFVAGSTGSVYIDSCIFTGPTTGVNIAGRSLTTIQVVRIRHSIFGNCGNLVLTNLGAGRVVNLNSVGTDTLDMQDNTIFNVVDRTVRYLTATQPVYSFKFNHNTVVDCISYHGFITVTQIDSLGNGPFEIKDNLFVDNYALGPDTDWTRQGEMIDNPDIDINGIGKCCWIITKPNKTTHNTPWVISNNYYYISDSGKAVRDFETGVGLHHVLYGSSAPEPIMTSDIQRQLTANGGNVATAFTKVNVGFNNVPLFPSKFVRWYFSPMAAGYRPTTTEINSKGVFVDSAVGGGGGKIKNASKPVAFFGGGTLTVTGGPLTQFVTRYNAYHRWPYDYNRMRMDSILDWLDCGFNASVNLTKAASDSKIVGSTMWAFGKVLTSVWNNTSAIPDKFSLNQNYPNPFNPSTKIEYTLQNASNVTLKVYNVLGQVVATLVSEKQDVGSHSATFDASKFTSGVYFYQINAGNYTATRKMMLIK